MVDLYFLHGDNHPQSRERLIALTGELKKQGTKELTRLDGQKVNLGEVKQALEAQSLFGGQRLVVIENLLSSPTSKRKKEIIDYLLDEDDDSPLILWEKKEIKGAVLNKFKSKFRAEIFKIPAVIFRLLDSLKPGDNKIMILLLHQIDPREPEMVFYMLCQRIRQLILAKDLGKKGLESLQGWQQARLINQAAYFELNQLVCFYQKLLTADYQQKTGQTPFSLKSNLDLLIANL